MSPSSPWWQRLPQPASSGVLFATGGIWLLLLLQPLPPLLTAGGTVAMLALMFAGIALEWHQSRDDVQKDAGRSAAIGAMPVAFICALLTALAVVFWPEARQALTGLVGGHERPLAAAFALGAVTAFFWLFVVHFVLLFAWWARRS